MRLEYSYSYKGERNFSRIDLNEKNENQKESAQGIERYMERKRKLPIKRCLITIGMIVLMVLTVWKLNKVVKTQLINRTGQTFETGVVVEILEDNIQENGMRVGQQKVVVKMNSGVKKGEELVTTSSAGYLSGQPVQLECVW